MLTVLFVIVFLAASVGAISLLDGQRASREVTNYLHEEDVYKRQDKYRAPATRRACPV